MIAAIAALAVLAAGAPSQTLERAIKLYDKADYLSASIELSKVVAGETGDDPANIARADFFLGKTFYQLGYLGAAMWRFEAMASESGHAYGVASLKWLLAIAARFEASGAGYLIAAYGPEIVDDPLLESGRDEAMLIVGRELRFRNLPDDGEDVLARVPRGTEAYTRAQLELGRSRLSHQDASGVDAMLEASRDPSLAATAVRETVMFVDGSEVGDAIARFVAAGVPSAEMWLSYAKLFVPHPSGPLPFGAASAETVETLAWTAVCPLGETSDMIAAVAPAARAADEQASKYLAIEDNAELYEAIQRQPPTDPAVQRWLDDDVTRGFVAWARELAVERDLLAASDAAWRSTRVATDVETETALRLALAEADTGRRVRDRLTTLVTDLRALAELAARSDRRAIPAGPDVADGDGLHVSASACLAVTGAAPPASPSRALPPAPRAKGCGCSTGASPGALSCLAAIVLALALRRGGRRRGRAASTAGAGRARSR